MGSVFSDSQNSTGFLSLITHPSTAATTHSADVTRQVEIGRSGRWTGAAGPSAHLQLRFALATGSEFQGYRGFRNSGTAFWHGRWPFHDRWRWDDRDFPSRRSALPIHFGQSNKKPSWRSSRSWRQSNLTRMMPQPEFHAPASSSDT